jgi:hypothetical protein
LKNEPRLLIRGEIHVPARMHLEPEVIDKVGLRTKAGKYFISTVTE